jgi:hypothetical protein
MIFLRSIDGYEIESRQIRDGRWQVFLVNKEGLKGKMANANYVWLMGNPSFKSIPKDYLIHHLDLNPLNDDISNLALMFRLHHMAYHFKIKNNMVPIEITDDKGNGYGIPKKKPKIRLSPVKDGCHSYIDYWDKESGKRMTIFSWDGVSIKTEKQAEELIGHLWPDRPWEFHL